MKQREFILITNILALLLSLLLIAKGIRDGFIFVTIISIIINALYIPGSLIFKDRFFTIWLLLYCVVQVIISATYQSGLFNNFSALFPIFIAILINPKYKKSLIIFYFLLIIIVFCLKNEDVIEFLIHITRSISSIYLLLYFLSKKYDHKKLELTEDEKRILDELAEKKLLKSVSCFSKNTVTQKLREARLRNDIDTNAELLAEYIRTK